ncbi:biotin/lipoyl-containing protein, partial [Pseudomonas sp. Pseusp97]|uniref:biotin/lipoyl-containing protein n=1 Tax=Pseudomonas sp. Pseusp97 TaxID=3243065 RepID=UPI0039A48647
MGTHVIKMPDIGEGIAEVELVEWHVQVGDEVHEDQLLAEVMTDKATVEIPSPVAGKIIALGGVPGQVMAVGGELIRLEVDGHGNHREAAQPKAQEEAPAKPEVKPAPVVEAPKPATGQGARPGRRACSRR